MMDYINFGHFKSRELSDFTSEILKKSKEISERIILSNSPVQIGDIVETDHGLVIVELIDIMASSSWGYPDFSRLSFEYWGKPVKKNGKKMVKRKMVVFDRFSKDGIKYAMPTCLRIRLANAHMYVE